MDYIPLKERLGDNIVTAEATKAAQQIEDAGLYWTFGRAYNNYMEREAFYLSVRLWPDRATIASAIGNTISWTILNCYERIVKEALSRYSIYWQTELIVEDGISIEGQCPRGI